MKWSDEYKIPTTGMDEDCSIIPNAIFYKDNRQLHWRHGQCPTSPACYIEHDCPKIIAIEQNEDWKHYTQRVFDYLNSLNSNERLKVIEIRVPSDFYDFYCDPVYGPYYFLADRHPSHDTRVKLICSLIDRKILH